MALLAIIPGLLATVGLVSADFSAWMLVGLILLAAFLVSAYWWNDRQSPAWSLMAAGMLASVGLTIASWL
jgi:membrane protein YdbS with pleckstrin-like domain